MGAAVALVLSVGAVYGMTGRTSPQLGNYPGGMMGGYGYGNGPTATSPTYPGGMMSGYRSGAGPTGGGSAYRGGMMGGFGGMMGGYGGYGGYGGMMGGSGGMMGGYGGMMSQYSPYPSNRTASGTLVVLFRNGFYPTALTVSKGSTVTWVNMDFVQHTVTSGSEQTPTDLFDSHELNHMQGFSYNFNTPGTYTYFCDIHPLMVGTITVTG